MTRLEAFHLLAGAAAIKTAPPGLPPPFDQRGVRKIGILMDANAALFACSATLAAPTDQVFDLFTNHIGRWWPIAGRFADGTARKIVIEPFAHGRFYEGHRGKPDELWGRVAAHVTSRTLIIDLELDPDFLPTEAPRTSVEIFFMPRIDGGTHLTIVHADLHRFPTQARARERFAVGWRHILDAFLSFAQTALTNSGARAQCCGCQRNLPPGLY